MRNYKKNLPRLTVKFLDGDDTSNVLFEVTNRNHMDIGEIFSDTYVTSLINQSIEDEDLPDNVIVLVTTQYRKV